MEKSSVHPHLQYFSIRGEKQNKTKKQTKTEQTKARYYSIKYSVKPCMACSSGISALKELRQEDCQVEESLVHITRTPLSKPNCYYNH